MKWQSDPWPFTWQPEELEQTLEGEEIAAVAARLLASPDGIRLIRHLRALTIDRVTPPDFAIGALRHLEGQRHIVRHLMSLALRGQQRPH